MIQKIAIISYVAHGRTIYGYDGHINPFKKRRTTILKENLEKALVQENLDIQVVVDVNHGDLPALKREGVDFFLIPEVIASYVDYHGIDKKKECFILEADEYENGMVERVIAQIKNMSESQ